MTRRGRRFLLFSGDVHYPVGGADDLVADYDTLAEALAVEYALGDGSEDRAHAWAHVYDVEEGRVVWRKPTPETAKFLAEIAQASQSEQIDRIYNRLDGARMGTARWPQAVDDLQGFLGNLTSLEILIAVITLCQQNDALRRACGELYEDALARAIADLGEERALAAFRGLGPRRARECSCGMRLDLDALREHGRQDVPEDEAACDCGGITKRFAAGGHASDCPGHPYTLILYNCPRCRTTIAEEIAP